MSRLLLDERLIVGNSGQKPMIEIRLYYGDGINGVWAAHTRVSDTPLLPEACVALLREVADQIEQKAAPSADN